MKINKPGHRTLVIIIIVMFSIMTAAFLYLSFIEGSIQQSDIPEIAEPQVIEVVDFESCVAAGNPIMESFPEQCAANDKTYIKKSTTETQ